MDHASIVVVVVVMVVAAQIDSGSTRVYTARVPVHEAWLDWEQASKLCVSCNCLCLQAGANCQMLIRRLSLSLSLSLSLYLSDSLPRI